MLLGILSELDTCKKRITLLEGGNKSLQTNFQYSQAEIENLKVSIKDVNFKQEAANTFSERIERELKELHRRHVKLLECHSRRGNIRFFGIKQRENESNKDTERALREFMRAKLKIPQDYREQNRFDRVHRITKRTQSNGRSPQSRPTVFKFLSNSSSRIFQEAPDLESSKKSTK